MANGTIGEVGLMGGTGRFGLSLDGLVSLKIVGESDMSIPLVSKQFSLFCLLVRINS